MRVITDTDGAHYWAYSRYDNFRTLGSGNPDAGYVAMALRGEFVQRGARYHVPDCRVVDIYEKCGACGRREDDHTEQGCSRCE